MRSRLDCSIIHYYTINAFKSMDSHLCTKLIFLGTFFFFTNTMRLHFYISDGDRQVFHGDVIIVIRVFFFSYLFYHC